MTIAVHSPSQHLLPATWKLIRLRLLLAVNGFKHAKTIRKILTIVGIVALLGLAAGIFVVSWLLLGFLHSPKLTQYVGLDVTPFLQAVPVLVLAALFLGILFSSFGVLLQALYLSGDMDFLLTSPVPIRAVFITKLLQAVLPNFGLIALFGLPVLYGLGLAQGYNILYYPLVLLTMVVLTLAAAGLSALLVMLVARLFPPRRVAEVLGFLTALITIVCSQSGNFYNTMGRDVTITGSQVNGMFDMLMRLNTPWLPLNWPGRGLVALGSGDWLSGLLLVGLTLGLSTLAFMFALVTAERWYYTGWAGMQVVSHKKKANRNGHARPRVEVGTPGLLMVSPAAFQFRRLLPAPVRAIVQKDFLVMRRDLRSLSQLVTPLIFGVFYTVMFLRPGNPMFPQGADMPGILVTISNIITTYGNVGMSLFVGWMLIARLSGMAFSAEGKNYWMLKSSPVRASHLLTAKFLVAYLPTLALGLVFLVGVSVVQKIPLDGILYSLLAVVMCLAGMDGILLAFGVAGARFDWTDPRRMNAGATGCLGQFLTALFLPLSFGAFIGPLLLVSALSWPQVYGYLVGGIMGVVIAGVCAILPPWLMQKRVERLGES
jgi:ABC-2 type transport system permease protein